MLGYPVRCPDCGGTFAAGPGGVLPPSDDPPDELPNEAAVRAAPIPGRPEAVTAAVPPPAPAATDPHSRPCPHCGERIEAAAVHCRFCGEDLAEEIDRPWERPHRPLVRRDCEPHRGVLILVLGILSLVITYLGVVPGIIAWVLGQQDLKKMTERTMDPQGRGLTQAGRICGIVGTILQGFLLLFVGAYFVFLFAVVVPATRSAAKPATPVVVPVRPAPGGPGAPAPPGAPGRGR
jgi:hypothetical protein